MIRLGETTETPAVPTAKVAGVSFQITPENSKPAVVIETTELNNYAFTQTRSYIYEVLLEKTSLDNSNLSGTRFPPKNLDKRGFEAVAIHQQNANVSVRIYVRDGARLKPVRAGNKLWVTLEK